MTTVVMVDIGDDVEMAWDSLCSRSGEPIELVDPKVFVNNGTIIAIAGIRRAASLLYAAKLPRYVPNHRWADSRAWVIEVLIPKMQEAVQGNPGMYDSESRLEFELMIVVDGQVYDIDSYWDPVRSQGGVYSIGSGSEFAKGAIAAGASPAEAIAIARDHDLGTGGAIRNELASDYVIHDEMPESEVRPTVKVGFRIPDVATYPPVEMTPFTEVKPLNRPTRYEYRFSGGGVAPVVD